MKNNMKRFLSTAIATTLIAMPISSLAANIYIGDVGFNSDRILQDSTYEMAYKNYLRANLAQKGAKIDYNEDGKAFNINDFANSSSNNIVEYDQNNGVQLPSSAHVWNGVGTPGDQVTEDLKVESVSAINAKQIKVVFNKVLDKATAETESNYSISGANGDARATVTVTATTGAELQDDKKSVILDIEGTPLNSKIGAKYFVSVSGVKDFAGEDVKDYSEVVSLYDTEAVKVSDVSFADNNTLRVKFSEPINTTQAGAASAISFKYDGVTVTVPSTAYTLSTDKTYVDVDVVAAGLSKDKNYTVVVDGLIDFASNALSKYETTISVAKDDIKPEVESVTVLSPNHVKVQFSEKIKNGISGFSAKVDGTAHNSIANENTSKPDGKTFIVNFSSAISDGNHVVTIYNFSDLSDNEGKTVTKEIKFAASKPVLTSTVAQIKDIGGSKYAVFTFDRNVVRSATTAATTYVDKDGITKTATLAVVGNAQVNGLEKNQIALNITSAAAGEYSFKFAKGDVVDTYGQQADEVKLSFVRTAETVKTIVSSVAGNTVSGTNTLDKVTVSFGADVDTDALNVTNYTVDGVQVFEKAIFDGNKQTVTLTLKSGAITTSGTKTIKVTGVKNVTDYSNTTAFRENVKPVVVKAELISYDQIRLTMSEAVSGTIDHNDIEVKIDGAKTSQNVTVGGAGTDTLIVKLNAADKLTSSTTPVLVSILSTNDIVDATGNKMDSIEINNVQVNFEDTGLSYDNAVKALETALNKDLTNSTNLVAAKTALANAEVAKNAAAANTANANKITEATTILTKVDDYIAAKAEASTKSSATVDATSTQLTDAKNAIDAIDTANAAVKAADSLLTVTALEAAIDADTASAKASNKATVKANMNAKFDVVITAGQDAAGKGKFTVVAPWLAAADLYDTTKFTITLSDSTNSQVVADGTTGLIVTAKTTTALTGTQTVKVKPLTGGTLESYFGADKEITLNLVNQGSAPTANDPIEIAE